MQNRERRYFTVDEIRAATDTDGDGTTIEGHAAVFDQLSEDLGGFREKIAPGAFTEAIETDDVRALFNHDPSRVLGRLKAGTLELEEDKTGLRSTIYPPDSAADVVESIKRGDVDQMSFGFVTVDESWEKKDGENIRTLEKVRLFDVSPVTYPAYPDTAVAVRSLEQFEAGEVAREHQTKKAVALRRRRLEAQEL
jgi:HK97 family phage prohead protease